MSQQLTKKQVGAGGFESIGKAEQVLCRLRLAGFTNDQLTVICQIGRASCRERV